MLSQLRGGDKLRAQNAASPLAGIDWIVGIVSTSQRWVMVFKQGDVNARRRVSEYELTQARFKLIEG